MYIYINKVIVEILHKLINKYYQFESKEIKKVLLKFKHFILYKFHKDEVTISKYLNYYIFLKEYNGVVIKKEIFILIL